MTAIDTQAAQARAAEEQRRRLEQLREQQRREAAARAAAQKKQPATPPNQREVFSGGRRFVLARGLAAERTDLRAPVITDVRGARAALQALSPKALDGNSGAAAKARQLMNRMAEAAAAHSGGQSPGGYCLGAVQDILEAGGFPGSQVPRMPEAHDFADHLNESPEHLKAAGLQRLDIDNPYDAPKGSIIVVRAGTPGTSHPTAGDIVIAGGDGKFYNDGEMGYGGPQNFPKGNDYVLGVYAPTGATGAAPSVEDALRPAALRKIMPDVSDATAKELAPVLRDAMTAAKVKTPKQAAAFTAMIAAGTDQLSSPDALQFIVDSARTWKTDGLGSVAQKGDLTRLAKSLDIELTPAQLNAGTRTPQSNEEEAFAYFVKKGLTPEQAAGIVGNLMQESGVDPGSHQTGGGPGRGIAQWSVGERWSGVEELAQKQGESPYDLGVQLDYMWQELNGSESAALASLKQASSASEAAVAFEEGYERAGIPNNGARIANAQGVLEKFGGYEYGGSQIGEGYYQRGLNVFGGKDAKSGAPAPSASTGGGVSSSGGAAAPASAAPAAAPSAPAAEPMGSLAPSPALASEAQRYGLDIDRFSLWFLEQFMSMAGDGLTKALENDPAFRAFLKKHGVKPGEKVPKALVAGFLAKKMKTEGIDPKQPDAAARLMKSLGLSASVAAASA